MTKLTKEERKEIAWEEYKKIVEQAEKEYDKIENPAYKKYQKIIKPASEKYQKIIKKIDKESEFNLSEKVKTKDRFNYEHQGFHSNPELLEVEDVKEFIKKLKERNCMFSDLSVICKTCGNEKRYFMRDASMCFDCYIDKLAGKKLK